MIATIKAEWRKNRLRPGFLISAGVLAAIIVVAYGVSWYLAFHPARGDRFPVSIAILYPDQFVNFIMGAGYPLGAAIAIVLGGVFAGSEYSWGTMKTMFTQGPGRLTTAGGRVVIFAALMAIMTLVMFVVGAASSAVIALFQGHSITAWPAPFDLAKGLGAVWLVFAVNGSIGIALGILLRNSAAALGIGLTYVLAVEFLAVRFIDTINNGAYHWIGNLFAGQNSTSLLQYFTSPAFPPSGSPAIGAEQTVLVLLAYFAGLVVVAAGAMRLRDVT